MIPRERDITDMICRGLPNKEIAYLAQISPRTLEKHIENILDKANVTSRAQLIVLELTGQRKWEG